MHVSKWGDRLAICLPPEVVEALDLKEGDDVALHVAGPATLAITHEDARQKALAAIAQLGWHLPADWRFDRDEANAR